MANSYAVLEKNATKAIRGYRSETELRHLIGTGVSAAAVWHCESLLCGCARYWFVGSDIHDERRDLEILQTTAISASCDKRR